MSSNIVYPMNKFWDKVEHWNTKLIPPAIVGLLFVIIIEIFFHEFGEHYHLWIQILDYLIIAVFVIDLIFLAIHAKTWKFFFKSYWLDIIAIIPLIIVFTIFSRIWRAASAAGQYTIGQAILHESLEARKGISAVSRSQKIVKYIRLGARSLRVISKSRLFTKLEHHTNRHKPGYKKNLKKVMGKRYAEKKR